MAHGRRNQNIDGGDRLQRKSGNFHARLLYGGLQRIDNLARQEGGDKLYAGVLAGLSDQRRQLGVVQTVMQDAVTDAIVVRGIFDGF